MPQRPIDCDKLTARLLAKFDKAALVEYIVRRERGWPCELKHDLLFAIAAHRAARQMVPTMKAADKVKRWLDRRHAIITDGDTMRLDFGCPSMRRRTSSTKVTAAWRRMRELLAKIRRLQATINAFEKHKAKCEEVMP
jgi:hypothetical protein